MAELTQEQIALLKRQADQKKLLEQVQANKVGVAEDSLYSIGSNLVSGTAGLLGAPTALFNLAGDLDKKIAGYFGREDYEPMRAPDVTGYLTKKASELTGGRSDYVAKTPVGKQVGNVASFLPAAGAAVLSMGATVPQALLYGVAAPAIGGQVGEKIGRKTGELLEMENPETAANLGRLAGEVASPFAATRVGPALSRVPKSPEIADVINEIQNLEGFMGRKVTPKSIQTSQGAMTNAVTGELSNPRLRSIISRQNEDFSRAVLKDAGITDETARIYGKKGGLTPNTVEEIVAAHQKNIGRQIGKTYDNLGNPSPWAVAGTSPLDPNRISNMAKGIPGFAQYVPGMSIGQYVKNVRTQAGEIISQAPNSTGGTSYKTQAEQLIKYIDDNVRNEIGDKAFGALEDLNAQYSKLISVSDALKDAAKTNRGIITPQNILAAGRTRHSGLLTEAAELADKYLLKYNLEPTAQNRESMYRMALNALGASGLGGLQLLQSAGATDPAAIAKFLGATILGGGGASALQAASKAVKGSDIAQDFARSRAMYKTANPYAVSAPILATGIGERQERKSGGRVNSHDAEADRLVMAAERAKRGLSAHTQGLLNTSDDSVASALEIANRSI